MGAVIAGLISSLPSIINAINGLIERGKQTGELTPAQADALTAAANAVFQQYGHPAPPPPGYLPDGDV